MNRLDDPSNFIKGRKPTFIGMNGGPETDDQQRARFQEPEYAKYLKYPMCLYFLDLLQYEHFRREVVNSQCTKFIDDQQILLWQHYTRRRTRLLQTASEQTQQHVTQNNGIVQPKVP
ncbi:Similar to MED31: Mediator of RNA polymerase II transcription subunit 31 (Aedes aegypti) [Cotesia congregata]|uniref:Mediator of RNA polymerase II transcription subunit 31 n=1 Tax=Cotesia congregata TaxID=51543 RepID=A0A8J2EKR2_COTCN|nr:Similar to MED31: Mediator of RNA polymerase II transcription subunit 31 (Aedes aegypti) [Cotesia congregata]